jgi:hypothetical protein
MMAKILAMKFTGYLSVGWNRFDFFIVVASIVDLFFVIAIGGSSVAILSFGP